MKMIIVTGLSGAGKSQAIRCFEDLGYFCVDNLPPSLIPKFSALCAEANNEINKVALVIDVRGREFFDDLLLELNRFKEEKVEHEILFLDSSDEVLVKRFKEARRKHPLAFNERIIDGIKKEKAKLKELKDRASNIIDTSEIKPRDLKEKIEEIYGEKNQIEAKLAITVLSFGFKYGIPLDSDLVVDVRFLPNPFYIPELKAMSGNETPVSDYVKSFDITKEFVDRYCGMLDFLIPNYFKEGKRQLIVSIGCTGGRHRSVTIAREIFNFLENRGHFVTLEHRDINEDVLKGGKKL